MNAFYIISSLILCCLTILCFYFPYKKGKKGIAIITAGILGIIILWTLIGQLDFLVIFIWPLILGFQIIFLSYWIFNFYGKNKIGKIISASLTFLVILVIYYPWINDWMFNSKEAKQLLAFQKIYLKQDFEIIDNESGGFTDYAHTFKLKISESDKKRIVDSIRNTTNYLGIIEGYNIPMANPNTYEHLNYETDDYINWEYYLKEPIEDGTYHFHFQLSKENNVLSYFGNNE
ncbi:hypothetical protein [Gramella sp. Hel_I_59]|uniref:hypothetical protein n=1 Tax=Gramella sp. Hel_I_59 TaxID=1249978 RepID=UPI001150DECC|nr:hypothetical protein [Gramella sp. Hel_I_59]